MLLVNTFDVEPWWSTIPPCIPNESWSGMRDRSERPLNDYLDLCDEFGVRCTFFVIGWYAQKYPHRVLEIVRRGHEVGCHSLWHEDVAIQKLEEFRVATRQAKQSIEDASGMSVEAYRAPSFSFPPGRCVELLRELQLLGFTIDSSITTAGRLHGGGYSKERFSRPENMKSILGVDIFEVPVPGVTLLGKDFQVFGGGYLRLTPLTFLRHIIKKQDYQVLYLHPHDFDTEVPHLPEAGCFINLRRKLRLGDLRQKVRELFTVCDVYSCGEILAARNVS